MLQYKTISEWCQAWNLPKPMHPLICVIKIDAIVEMHAGDSFTSFCDFYTIALKHVTGAENLKIKYGQKSYDFNEGVMSFVSPKQVTNLIVEKDAEVRQLGWYLLVHPDLLWNTHLAARIKQYDFWDYTVNESLFLSENEESIMENILQNIQHESSLNLDRFSKQIIVAQLESLLSYAERFYNRQFITREKGNLKTLDRLEKIMNDYFNSDQPATKGLPTVSDIAAKLHVSAQYLSGLLRIHTGQNTQNYIHEKIIEKAKERISTTDLSISEIAYELGFTHLQSFSRLFKSKTQLSPMEFRQTFEN